MTQKQTAKEKEIDIDYLMDKYEIYTLPEEEIKQFEKDIKKLLKERAKEYEQKIKEKDKKIELLIKRCSYLKGLLKQVNDKLEQDGFLIEIK